MPDIKRTPPRPMLRVGWQVRVRSLYVIASWCGKTEGMLIGPNWFNVKSEIEIGSKIKLCCAGKVIFMAEILEKHPLYQKDLGRYEYADDLPDMKQKEP